MGIIYMDFCYNRIVRLGRLGLGLVRVTNLVLVTTATTSSCSVKREYPAVYFFLSSTELFYNGFFIILDLFFKSLQLASL